MQAHIGELERALSQGKNGAQQQVVQLQQQLAQTEQQLAESRQQLEQGPARRRRGPAGRQQAAPRQPPPQPAVRRTWSTTPRPSRCWPWPSRPPTSTSRSPRPRPSGCSPRRKSNSETTIDRGAGAGPAARSTRPRAGRSKLDEESTARATAHRPGRRAARRHHHRAVRAAQGRARASGRGAAHLRARVPHPAQELPRVAAARPRRERQRRAGPERRHGRGAAGLTFIG